MPSDSRRQERRRLASTQVWSFNNARVAQHSLQPVMSTVQSNNQVGWWRRRETLLVA